MLTETLLTLTQMAQRLGVTMRWLKREALGGGLPCLNLDGRLLFSPEAVERALTDRAAGADRAVEHA